MLIFACCHCGHYHLDLSISFADSLTIFGAAIAFGFGYYQYRKGIQWKKTEFIISLIKDFKENFNVKRATLMLDWVRVNIPLTQNEIEGKHEFFFTDDLFKSALRNHFLMKNDEGFSSEEAIIRLVFDDFLDRLGQFNQFIKNGVIKPVDLEIYIGYWINIIGDEKNNSKDLLVRQAIWNYIKVYEFNDVIDLCERYGFNIKLA